MILVCVHCTLPTSWKSVADSVTARSLDEGLHTRGGPIRNFLILARYCSQTVFQEQVETIGQNGSVLWPSNIFRLFGAWASFMRVEIKLSLYEYYISLQRFARLLPIANI